MNKQLVLIIVFSGLTAQTGAGRCDELTPLQPSKLPNLDVARIAGRHKAMGGVGNLVTEASRMVSSHLFNATFNKQAAELLAQGHAKVKGGAQVAVLVAEIYTNAVGYKEIGPIAIVEGPSLMAALKTHAGGLAQPRIIKDRPGMTKSYKIMVLSNSQLASGFREQVFPDELMSIATQHISLDAVAKSRLDIARDAAKAAAAVKAREKDSQKSRDHEGPRENSRLGAGLGGNTGGKDKGSTKGAETKGPDIKGPDTKGSETKGSEIEGPEIRIH